ncbi:MAG: hypothetical protein EA418_12985 [Wenzhouxiangellaceae bacterium]|nr:MAG: hypothetical protein EA418_12985 [Wenzhouxiangellaceae bacterium]
MAQGKPTGSHPACARSHGEIRPPRLSLPLGIRHSDSASTLVGYISFNQQREQVQGLLPAQAADLRWNHIRQPFLDDVQVGASGDPGEGIGLVDIKLYFQRAHVDDGADARTDMAATCSNASYRSTRVPASSTSDWLAKSR